VSIFRWTRQIFISEAGVQLRHQLRHWIPKIGYSIADQGFISGANFVLNILLAKWILPDEYGLFGITFSLFLFLSGFHNALLIEPLVVIGPARYGSQTARYLTMVVCLHLLFSLIITVLLLVAAPFIIGWQTGLSLWMLVVVSISSFSILLFWLLRRAAYLEGNADLASRSSFFYLLTLLAGTFWFHQADWINVINAYLLMSAASLIAAGVLWYRLGINLKHLYPKDDQLTIQRVLVEHWQYGRWIVAGTLAYSFSTLIYVPLVGAFAGLAASGVLRAMQNLVQPVQQIIVALSTFFVPWLSKQRNIRGNDYPLQIFPKVLCVFVIIGIIFLLPIVLFGQELVRFVYSNEYYYQYDWVLYYVAIAAIIQVMVYAIATIVRSIEYSNAIFWEEFAGACFVLTIGLLLIWKWGLAGVSVSLIGSTISQVIVMVWLIHRRMHLARTI